MRGRITAVVALTAFAIGVPVLFLSPVRDWLRPPPLPAPSGDRVGSIASLRNEVRHRNQAGFEWGTAQSGQSLEDGDKVRTGGESEAVVEFLEGSNLVIGAQALVTIRAPRGVKGEGDLVAEVEVEGGEVRVALTRTKDGRDRRLQVQSRGRTVADLSTSSAQDGFAEMSVVMQPDRSLRIVSVRGGGVRVGGKGKLIVLEEGQAATDGEQGVALAVASPLPSLAAPSPSASVSPSPRPSPRTALLPPPSSVLLGEEGKSLLVSGRAKPGTSLVNVNGKPAEIKEGQFQIELPNLRPGKQKVTIEEIDREGNVTYTKRDVEIREKK